MQTLHRKTPEAPIGNWARISHQQQYPALFFTLLCADQSWLYCACCWRRRSPADNKQGFQIHATSTTIVLVCGVGYKWKAGYTQERPASNYSTVGGNWSTRWKPKQTQGECVNSTQKDPSCPESNPGLIAVTWILHRGWTLISSQLVGSVMGNTFCTVLSLGKQLNPVGFCAQQCSNFVQSRQQRYPLHHHVTPTTFTKSENGKNLLLIEYVLVIFCTTVTIHSLFKSVLHF